MNTMQKLSFVLLIFLAASLSTGCMATRKFARNEVKASADKLNARIDTTTDEIKETRDGVNAVNQRVSTVDGKVTDLDSRTSQGLATLKTDVQSVDQKTSQVHLLANRTAGDVVILDQRFQNRNHFTVAAEKTVQFKFDSASLDNGYETVLDEVAEAMNRDPDAIVVLEGRTDSIGRDEYNVRLGERRIESVRRYLAIEKGVPVYRIHQISLGAANPMAPNDSRDGREKNRAVKMMILVPLMERGGASSG